MRVGIKTFLVPAYTGLGNFILCTPMVRAIRERIPEAKVYVLAGNSFGTEEVFDSGGEYVDEVLWLDEDASWFEKIRFFLKLRRRNIDAAFLPMAGCRNFLHVGTLLAGIPVRAGHTAEVLDRPMGWRRRTLTHEVPLRLATHESDLYFDLLDAVTGEARHRYDTCMASGDEAGLEKFGLEKGSYIVFQLAAANGAQSPKIWESARFAALAGRLAAAGELPVFAGDAGERELIGAFLKEADFDGINLAGETSVREISTVIKYARLLVCHDSGLMHVGNAHGTPLVAIYGPTDHTRTAPRAVTSRVVRTALSCQPCMKDFAKTEAEALRDCEVDVQCMRDVGVEEVYEACREMLAGHALEEQGS